MIREEHGKWVVYKHTGEEMGRHDTEAAARIQEQLAGEKDSPMVRPPVPLHPKG